MMEMMVMITPVTMMVPATKNIMMEMMDLKLMNTAITMSLPKYVCQVKNIHLTTLHQVKVYCTQDAPADQ